MRCKVIVEKENERVKLARDKNAQHDRTIIGSSAMVGQNEMDCSFRISSFY